MDSRRGIDVSCVCDAAVSRMCRPYGTPILLLVLFPGTTVPGYRLCRPPDSPGERILPVRRNWGFVPSLRDSFHTNTLSVSLPRHYRAGLQILASLTGLICAKFSISAGPPTFDVEMLIAGISMQVSPRDQSCIEGAPFLGVRRTLQTVARDRSPGDRKRPEKRVPRGTA